MVANADEDRGFLKDLPIISDDSFRISTNSSSNIPRKNSIYPTTQDIPIEQRIVNEPKPQVTLNYLRVRGGQYKRLSQSERNHAKRKRINCAKAQP